MLARFFQSGAALDSKNLTRIAALNREFHSLIAHASDSPRSVNMLSHTAQVPLVQQTFRPYSEGQLQRSFMHHRALIDAFRAGYSAWVRDVMSCHVRAARFAMPA